MTLVSTDWLSENLNKVKIVDASWHLVKNRNAREEYNKEHIEVVKVTFDPKIISYEDVTRFFFKIHDPTTLNRQGPNVGYQYRSEIFYTNEKEKISAQKILDEVNKKLNGKVVTVIRKEKNYCRAEEYHQKYFEKRSKR